MSYPVTDVVQLAPTTTAAVSYAASLAKLSGDWADGDWIFLAIACSNATGGVTLAHDGTTGWSEVVELDVSSGVRMAVYKAKITGGTIGNPTINLSSGTGLWSAFAWIENDADATDPCPANHYGTADGGNATSFSSATLTPGGGSPVDNCRIVYFAATRGSSDNYLRMLDSAVVGDSLLNITDGSVSMAVMVASTSQTTAAATAKTIYNSTTLRAGCITLAIKPGAGGKRAKSATLDITRLAWLGSFGATHDGTLTPVTTSWGDPVSRTISDVAVSTTGATRITNVAGLNEWGTYDNNSCTLSTAGWQGKMLTFSADVDMTGKMFALEWNSPSFASQVGDKGLILVFEDNAGTNWSAFQLSQKIGFQWSNEYGSIIDLENATPFDSGGTLVWSQVRKVTPLLHRSGASAASRSFSLKNMLLIGKTTMVGGCAERPLDINYLRQALHGMGYMGLVGGEAPAVTIRSDVQVGDGGTTPTYYDATGTLHAFPEAYDALTQREVNIPANQLDFTVKAGSSDTINLTATAVSATQEQNFTIDAASSTSAAYSLVGSSFIGVKWTNNVAINYSGCTFSGCALVELGGNTITGATVTDPASSAAATESLNNATLEGCTIDISGTSATYHLALSSAVTDIEINNPTFSGTPAIYSALASGTLTITNDGTGTALDESQVTFVGGSTAVAVVAAPELYQSAAITGLAATYRIQLFDIEYDLTVSGITVTPTAGATYTHGGITWTVRSTSIVAGAGTITVYGAGTPSASGTLTKASGTGDASVTFSAYVVDGTELYIGVPGATSYTWTDTVAAAAPRVIRLRVMEDGPGTADAILMIDAIIGVCGITDGTESVGYLVAAVADDVYNDRGVDGSTVTGITIDDSTLRLEIASGTIVNYNGTDVLVIDGRDIYAYETYWLGTTAGMRDQARFIEAVDAVNFRCSNFKLLGTSGYPIMIRNCYMVDAATGIFASLVDYSGDPISNAPDHMAAIVVSTSDSVVTGSLSEFIAAVPTANAIANQVVNGITFP